MPFDVQPILKNKSETYHLQIPQADNSGYFIPTLNKTGYMTTHLDPFSQAFVEYASKDEKGFVLEVGAAYGIATLAALACGAKVICNDIEPRHLKLVKQHTALKNRFRLKIVPGDFPYEVQLPSCSLDAILMCRVLHLFNGQKVEDSIQKAYQILKPGGKIFIVVDTPYLKILSSFIPEYERRLKTGVKWPGFIQNLREYVQEEDLPDMVNFLDEKTLKRILEDFGFTIEKISFIDRWDFPPNRRLDGRESLGVIARK